MSPRADLLLVTATQIESQAVLDNFQDIGGLPPKPMPIADKMYHYIGVLNETKIFMVQSEMGSVGLGASLQTVERGINALKPSAVILIGVAFGISEEKQNIGDILVSRQLLLYELQRVGREITIIRGDKPHCSPWLLDRIRSVNLYQKDLTVHYGVVLTGEKLVDNIDYRDQLKKIEQDAVGGEMEGAGLYVACNGKVDWILIKGICDWADGNKGIDKDQRQKLAARNAVRLVLHTLQQAPLKRENRNLFETS